ncbi:MAG: RNA 2',3'-cyclic phosphodiesterase [candidate division Zixibacteria bacterium]|nr:RNA 2',3'-cyclic phosphodiesterase [candidate division Zixibacteria bacterium]
MRLFVAAPFPAEVKNDLGKLIDDWRKEKDKVGWVKKENLHLTLKFLGETPLEKMDALKRDLAANLNSSKVFSTSLSGAGAFPNLNRARVIWIGVSEGKEKLSELAQKVEKATRPLGFPAAERAFSAHLTIGRVKDSRLTERLLAKIRSCTFEAQGVIVSEVVLYQSELAPGGSVYTPLARFELAK